MNNWLSAQYLPPGLRELAYEENLTEAQVKQLADAWDTIRGHRPKTLEEWRPFYNAVKGYLREDYGKQNEPTQVSAQQNEVGDGEG